MERAKETIRKLKTKASFENNMKKTIFAVSHSDFMAALYCLITQQNHIETLIPDNLALMIIDFE